MFTFQDVKTYTTGNGYVFCIILVYTVILCALCCFNNCLCVLLGGEGDGLSSELRQLCDVLLTISPRRDLLPGVESLNVSVATGTTTYKTNSFFIPVID